VKLTNRYPESAYDLIIASCARIWHSEVHQRLLSNIQFSIIRSQVQEPDYSKEYRVGVTGLATIEYQEATVPSAARNTVQV
jgi:hypothetical protein